MNARCWLPPALLFCLLLFAAGCGESRPVETSSGPEPGSAACKGCHGKIVDSFVRTAHFNTSAPADSQSIKGHFTAGQNDLRTARKGVHFRMESSGGVFNQTAFDDSLGQSRTERFDLVIGSGRVGQSYLYWSGALLFQLPVSYLTGTDEWINSPGYSDGQIDFGRFVPPRCLECHSTYFRPLPDGRERRYSGEYMLGVSCSKCHGPARLHVEYQASHPADTHGRYILNPARFPRDRRIDGCAFCHSGLRKPSVPSFSFRPGDRLDDFFVPEPGRADSLPDVHGNQVGLLRRSKCFRSSPTMSCSTCHDVHQPQRDVVAFVPKCLTCHTTSGHPQAEKIGSRMMTDCIDCHMPILKSRLIRFSTPTTQFSPDLRTHLIGVYRD